MCYGTMDTTELQCSLGTDGNWQVQVEMMSNVLHRTAVHLPFKTPCCCCRNESGVLSQLVMLTFITETTKSSAALGPVSRSSSHSPAKHSPAKHSPKISHASGRSPAASFSQVVAATQTGPSQATANQASPSQSAVAAIPGYIQRSCSPATAKSSSRVLSAEIKSVDPQVQDDEMPGAIRGQGGKCFQAIVVGMYSYPYLHDLSVH